MKHVTIEIIEKLMEAKKLEKEALMMLLPEKMQGHIDVIAKEMEAIVLDCFEELNTKDDDQETSDRKSDKDKSTSKVRKVDIG